MVEELSWHCIGHDPTIWALGIYADRFLTTIHSTVERQPEGTWHWSLEGDCLLNFGVEPSRLLAIEAATKANRVRHNQKMHRTQTTPINK